MWALFVALIVKYLTVAVTKFKPPYSMAYKATFFGAIFSGFWSYKSFLYLGVIVPIITNWSQTGFSERSTIMMILGGFVVQSLAYGFFIKNQNNEAIGFINGAQISGYQLLIGAAILSIG